LAIWALSGMAAASFAIYARNLVSLFTPRRATIAVVAFCAGALPLIAFNIHSNMSTFRGNVVGDSRAFPAKARFLAGALDGGGLFGYLEWDNWQTLSPHAPSGIFERASAELADLAGHPRRDGMIVALAAAVLFAPFAGWAAARQVLLFLTAGAIAWLEMALNANTGGSIHHTILLWPLPQAIVAVAFAGASQRLGRAGFAVLTAAVLLLTSAGVLVTNEYHAQIVRNGGTVGWSPALFRLSHELAARAPRTIFCVDWGMLNSLLLLQEGRVKLYMGSGAVFPKRELTPEDRRAIEWMLTQPDALFVAHSPEAESFSGANERLAQASAELGYRRNQLATITDGYGRATFEVYQMVR